jgi:hypothetical protein
MLWMTKIPPSMRVDLETFLRLRALQVTRPLLEEQWHNTHRDLRLAV